MTNKAERIVAALEMCNNGFCEKECYCRKEKFNCIEILMGDAADMIERLSEEIQQLKEKPMHKPLTLEEFKKSGFAFIELEEECYASYVFPAQYIAFGYNHYSVVLTKSNAILERFFGLDDDENQLWIDNDEYGCGWRCWATNPTDEERKAAKWDD